MNKLPARLVYPGMNRDPLDYSRPMHPRTRALMVEAKRRAALAHLAFVAKLHAVYNDRHARRL